MARIIGFIYLYAKEELMKEIKELLTAKPEKIIEKAGINLIKNSIPIFSSY